jgi:hypothetical protein
VERLAAVGFSNLTVDELIAMKVHGITPAYIEAMRAIRLEPGVDQLIAMKVQGVTPEYMDEARRLVADPSVEDVIAMKVHGVTPRYVREMQATGIEMRSAAGEFIAAKAQGITPEFVKSAVDHGFRELTLGKLIMLRNADII